MAIRFSCPTCNAVLKIPEMIKDSKKVRCTGCAVVLIVSPSEDDPDTVTATVAQRVAKPKSAAKSERNQIILFTGGLILLLVLLAGLWWISSAPKDRGAIEGQVTLDETPLESGTIEFIPAEDQKIPTVTTPIVRGRYSLSASKGPAVGLNVIKITSEKMIAPKYNTKSELKFVVAVGSNNKDFEVRSK